MAQAGRVLDAGHERAPARALSCERLSPAGRELVVAAAALPCLLDPAPEDQPAVLEPVEHGIQGRDVERYGAAGARLDSARDVVAVALAMLELRQHEQLGRALLQRRVLQRNGVHMVDMY